MRLLLAAFLILSLCGVGQAADPLPSWNEGPTKASILGFVQRVTEAGSADYVPPAERIVTFDNDGALWAEQPMYFQAFFAFDRVKQLAPEHPEWREQEPFASVLRGDTRSALAGGEKALLEIVMATHAGITTDEFEQTVVDWMATARHHTDADREWAYDRESHVGRLDRGLDEASKRGWTVIDMERDWRQIFVQHPD